MNRTTALLMLSAALALPASATDNLCWNRDTEDGLLYEPPYPGRQQLLLLHRLRHGERDDDLPGDCFDEGVPALTLRDARDERGRRRHRAGAQWPGLPERLPQQPRLFHAQHRGAAGRGGRLHRWVR